MNLKPFVNDRHLWEDFTKEIEDRITKLHKYMETRTISEAELRQAQGGIKELRSLLQLRDKVNGG